MANFGENLRTEREARGISLDDISSATKISVRLLQAIENEEFDRLPGGVFNINFVRQYARFLGVEEDKVVNEYRRLTAPILPEGESAEASPQRPIIPPDWAVSKSTEYEWDRSQRSNVWMIATFVLLVVAVSAVGYMWLSQRHAAPLRRAAVASPKPAETTPAPVAAQPAPEAAQQSPQQPASVEPKAAQPPVTSNERPSTSTTATAPTAADVEAPVRVEITAESPVWVSAASDGAPKFQVILRPQETRFVAARSTVRLRVGDAAALLVKLNGQTQPSIGPRGLVRTVILTPQGMRVVTPPPPDADPADKTPPEASPSAAQVPQP